MKNKSSGKAEPADDPLKGLMKRTPPRGECTQIEDVFGLLERERQRSVSIEEIPPLVSLSPLWVTTNWSAFHV